MSAAPVQSVDLKVAGPAGALEAVVDRVAELRPQFACVVCHPHPQHEGTMHNKVVTTVARTAARCGGVVVRFNFRGVGASAGRYDGDRGELDDALAVVAAIREDFGPELPLVVAGFSFGGAIAYRVAGETDIAALVTIAPAWERIAPDTRAEHTRWLLIQGGSDEIIPTAGVLQWARTHAPAPEIVQIESAGHFFHGRLPQLAAAVESYLERQGF